MKKSPFSQNITYQGGVNLSQSRPAIIGNQGGDAPPPDLRAKSWQVVNFCWQVLRHLKSLQVLNKSWQVLNKSWQVVDFCWQVLGILSWQVLFLVLEFRVLVNLN